MIIYIYVYVFIHTYIHIHISLLPSPRPCPPQGMPAAKLVYPNGEANGHREWAMGDNMNSTNNCY